MTLYVLIDHFYKFSMYICICIYGSFYFVIMKRNMNIPASFVSPTWASYGTQMELHMGLHMELHMELQFVATQRMAP